MERQTLTISETAQILGMSPQGVREHMKRDLFQPPIGKVMPSLQGKQTRYLIFREALNKFIGGTL